MRVFVLLVAMCILSVAKAQEPDYPKNFARILQPGDHVGLYHPPETGSTRVTIYSSKAFDVITDAQKLTPEQLDAKYPAVAKVKRQRIEAYQETLAARRTNLPEGKVFAPPEARVHASSRTKLGTIVHVGEDYFVVEHAGSPSRSAYPIGDISRVDWIDEAPLSVSARIVDTEDAK